MRSYTLPNVAELLGISIEDVDYLIEQDKIRVCVRLPECRAYPDEKSRREVTILPGLYRIDPLGAKNLLAAKNRENPKGYLVQCQPEPSVDDQIVYYFDPPSEFPSFSPAPLISYYDLRVSEDALAVYRANINLIITEAGEQSLKPDEDRYSELDEEQYKEPGYLHQIIGLVFNREYKNSGNIPSFKKMRTLFENKLYEDFDEEDCIQEVADEGIYWSNPSTGKEYNPMTWKRFENYLSELRKPLKRGPSF